MSDHDTDRDRDFIDDDKLSAISDRFYSFFGLLAVAWVFGMFIPEIIPFLLIVIGVSIVFWGLMT